MTALLQRARSAVDDARDKVGNNKPKLPSPARFGVWAVGLVLAYFVANALLPNHLPIGIVVLGMVFGSFYALGAVGVVLIYRANRVLNFAQAEFGSVAAVLAIEFKLKMHMNYFMAIFLGLVIAAILGAVINVLIIRRFREAPRLILSVVTIGLAELLAGIAQVIPVVWSRGISSGQFATPFQASFKIYPVIFNGNHLLAMIVVPIVMVALILFLRFSDYGVVIRASSENADRAMLLGVPVPRLSTIVWSLAAVLSAIAVIVRVPILGFTSFISVSGGGPHLLLATFAPAVVGRLENLPRTVIAALAIGVFENAAIWQVPRTTIVDAMLVLVILVALLLQRDFFVRAAETGISSWKAIKEVRSTPSELKRLPEVRLVFGALKGLLLGVTVAFPLMVRPSSQSAGSLVLIYAMVAVSLWVLTGWAGQISLGQFALAGFGAATTSVLYGRHHWDITLAILAGTILTALVALAIGIPALRIRGPFLAVITLGFAVTSQYYFLQHRYFPWFIQETIERPTLWNRLSLQSSRATYYFCLVALLFVMYAARNMRRTHVGRSTMAVRDNEVAAQSVTLNTTFVKLQAFVISGAIAGFAGAVYVLQQGGLHSDSFTAPVSEVLFTMVVIGGLGSLPGAITGAIYIRLVEFLLPPAWRLLASGVGILFILLFVPDGLGGVMYTLRDKYLRAIAKRRGILVPSLVADRRVVQAEEAPIAIDTALGGLAGAAGSNGSSNGHATNPPDDDTDDDRTLVDATRS